MAAFYCCALVEGGHRVILVCGEVPQASRQAGERMLDELRRSGVETVTLPELGKLARPRTVARLKWIVEREHADCVISFQQRDQTAALWAAYRAGVPGIISAQNRHTFWGKWPIRKVKESVFAASTRRLASLAICTSEAVQSELIDRFGVAREKTTVLPNGVDVLGFPQFAKPHKDRVRAELGISKNELLLVNVGRIDPQKAQDLLVEAFSRVDGIGRLRLVLAGGISHGGNEERMRKFLEAIEHRVRELRLGNRVVFAGWRDDVPLLLSTADIYVHSARWEGWPLVVVEAMAAGVPVIATDCAGWPQGFQNGVHGQIVPRGNVEELRAAIADVAGRTCDERASMGAAARRLAETQFDIRTIGKTFVGLVESVLQWRNKPGKIVGSGRRDAASQPG